MFYKLDRSQIVTWGVLKMGHLHKNKTHGGIASQKLPMQVIFRSVVSHLIGDEISGCDGHLFFFFFGAEIDRLW